MSHSFSIRDFTSKMRTRDVFKCWPFPAGDATAEEVRSWLPPMPVKKFRWWSDQFTGGLRNPPPGEEEDEVSGELEESERSPEEEQELEEEKSENPPVGETDSRRENGERGSENSKENEAEEEEKEEEELEEKEEEELEEEKLENPPVEETDSRLENGEGESEVSTEKEVEEEQKEVEEEEKSEMVCPVCRDFNAATLTTVNAHIDGCLRKERRQRLWSKSIMEENKKRRKKRSIAEIFDAEEEEIGKEQEQEQEENPQEQEQQRSEIETARPFGEDVFEASNAGGEAPIEHQSEKSDEGGSNSVPEDPLLPSPEEEEEEKSEMVCPVCRVFTAATVTAANAHIDSCLAQAMREERWPTRKTLGSNLNPKPQKKRSIAEILNVAPQIEGGESHVEIREEEEEEGKDEERVAIKSKKKKKKTKKVMKKMLKKVMKKNTKVGIKHRGVELLKRSRRMMKKKTTTKKKKKRSDELVATKEDACKSKVQNSEDGSRELEGNGNKTVELDNIDASITHEKELDSEILSEEMNAQEKNGDSVGKQQEAVLSSISGTLRSHEHISGSTSGGCNNQEGTEEIHCDVQLPTSDRHVKFSGKDCILGLEDRNSYDEAASNLASEALAFSSAKEQSCGSDEATGNFEANRNDEQSSGSHEETGNLEANRNNDNNAISIDKGKEVCPIVESKQFSIALGHVAVQSFLEPSTDQEKSMHLVEKGESSSKVASCDKFDKGNTTPPHCSPYADISRSLSALQAGQICRVNRQVFDSGAFISTEKFIDRLDDLSIQSAPMNSNASARKFLEPSSSNSASYDKGNERSGFRLCTHGDQHNNGKALSGRPSSYMLSADKIDNSLLLLGQGKGSVRDNRMDQNFIGLPLNSHGELINFSSSGKVGMNQPDTTSCTLRGSFNAPVNDIIHQNRKEEYLSLSERLVAQKAIKDQVKPIPHYPARLGVTESHGRGRADIYQHNSDRHFNQSVQPLDSELNLARSPFIEQNQLDKMPNHKGNGMISPKESSGLVSPSSSQPTVRLMGKDVPIGGTSKEKQQSVRVDGWAGEESKRKHCSAYAAVDNSSLGRFSKQDWVSGSQLQTSTENVLPSVKIQSNPSLQNTFLMKGNPGISRNASSNLHHSQVPTSNAVYNRAPSDLPWQLKPQALSFQSQALPTPQLTSSSQGELNDRKKHPHFTSSAFGFPFMHPVGEEQAKTSLVRSLPSWLSGSTHEWLPETLASKSLPQDTLGNSFTTPSVIHSADFQYTLNSVNSRCPSKTPLFPASTVQPPHVPGTPFAINSRSRNIIKVTDILQLNDMTTEDHHPSTNTRKRLAADLVDLTRPNKLPNIGQCSSAGFQRNARAVELDPRVNGASTSRRQNEAQNLNPTSYLGFDFSNRDGVATSSGPVKLSPGTKRVGRPSQNVDQDDNTRTKW